MGKRLLLIEMFRLSHRVTGSIGSSYYTLVNHEIMYERFISVDEQRGEIRDHESCRLERSDNQG